MNKSTLLATSSAVAVSSVLATTAAFAQGGGDIEQVVVSASRISIAGYQQPTPVSVIGAAALAEAANADIGDTLREMPSMGSALTPEKGSNGNASNSGAIGVSNVNLRNLGTNRNLVLFDGQRVVSPIAAGGVDLSAIPSTLIQRVDVVTGGASAAWGSDAVSGVINLIVNKSFTGFKASIDGQDTGQDTRRSYGFTVTDGFDLDGGRAHIVGAVTYNISPAFVFVGQANWFRSSGLFPNPAFNATTNPNVPVNVHYNQVGASATAGGVIRSGPLAGIQFGPGGTPSPYYFGVLSGTSEAGGSANPLTSSRQVSELSFPLAQGTGFFYGSYKLTPDIQAGLMLNYGWDRSHSSSLTILNSANVIKTDNAYLDPTIAARMATLGVTSFNLAELFTDPINMKNANFYQFNKTIGLPVAQSVRQLYRAVFTLDGALGEDWSWNAGVQHSESHLHEIDTAIEIRQNLTNATDAVRVTAANAGASGLTIGSIACRSTLTAPTNGCVPLDILGTGVASQAAVNYVNDNNDWTFVNLQQDSAAASMQGKLPWDLFGAGVPSVAFGAEYRKEQGVATAAYNPTNILLGGGNFQPLRGEFNVEEGFGEVDLPLIKNGIVQNLEANIAGRYTSYSISGAVQTWKLGLSSQVIDDVRLRTTWSADIRAPNLGELFNQIPASGNPIDPKTGKSVTTQAFTITANNLNLQPEKAITVSGGVVLTPHWVPGLTMSFDWYSINVHGFIAIPGQLLQSQQCQAGNAFACSQYIYSGSTLTTVFLRPQNAATMSVSGLDFQADYAMDLFTGNLALHLLGNYADEQTESAFGAASFDFAGSMGPDSQFIGVPKTHFNLSATYTDGPWSGTVQTRFIGTAKLNNAWATGVQVDNNAIPAVAYLDLRATYKWNDNVQFYTSVDNTLDTPPPDIAGLNTSTNSVQTTSAVYDTLGRMYHAGVRFSY